MRTLSKAVSGSISVPQRQGPAGNTEELLTPQSKRRTICFTCSRLKTKPVKPTFCFFLLSGRFFGAVVSDDCCDESANVFITSVCVHQIIFPSKHEPESLCNESLCNLSCISQWQVTI